LSVTARKPNEELENGATFCHILKHPLRARILEVVNQTPMSPIQFVDRKLVPPEIYADRQQALSLTAYHVRMLAKEGCVQIAERHPRRGAVENVYGGCLRSFSSDEEFERLPFKQRRQLSRISFQGLAARIEGALRSGALDKRRDRRLTWLATDLDEQGWEEMKSALAKSSLVLEQICERAESRIGDPIGGAQGTRIPVTLALLGFESPSLSGRY
jgi:hypothetical protein